MDSSLLPLELYFFPQEVNNTSLIFVFIQHTLIEHDLPYHSGLDGIASATEKEEKETLSLKYETEVHNSEIRLKCHPPD